MVFLAVQRSLIRLIAVVIFLLTIVIAQPVQAGGIRAAVNNAQQKPGKVVTFTLGATSLARINRVVLIYGIRSSSCTNLSQRSEPGIDAGYQVNARYEWNLEDDDAFLPGIALWWQWEIHDEAGNELLTEPQTIVIEDPQYKTWHNLEQGKIRLYWTDGGLDFGKRMLDKAVRSMDRLEVKTGVQSPGNLRIVIYPSVEAMLKAATGIADWAGGVAYPKFDVVLIGISEQDPYQWAARAIPHELAHLLLSIGYSDCESDPLPLWLAEGLAQYAEGKMPQEQRSLAIRAMDEEKLPGLEVLSSEFPTEAKQAQLAYAHSRAVVEYLVESQGVEKMDRLLGYLREGKAVDLALRPVYGIDTAGLDQAWRASEGFSSPPELSFVTLTPTPTITRTPLPKTNTPSPAPSASPTRTEQPSPSASPERSMPVGSGRNIFPAVLLGFVLSGIGVVIVRYLRGARNG